MTSGVPPWLIVLLTLFSTAATVISSWAIVLYRAGQQTRTQTLNEIKDDIEEGFKRNDGAMGAQSKLIEELRDRVGTQNGRVGKLEEWKAATEKRVDRIESTRTRRRSR